MLRQAIALSALLFMTTARAQVSGSVALVSDYRFRGISLSDERPAAQLGVAYDGRGDWYAGALVSVVRPSQQARAQWLTYLGMTRPLRASLDWEAGLEYASIAGDSGYAYPEAYLGLASEHYNLRVYYARNYFGQGSPALYAALDRHWRLSERLRLLAHVGLLRRNGGGDFESNHYRADARIGLAATWRDYHLQLFWTIVRGSDEPYPFDYSRDDRARREAWGISCSRSW